MKKKTFHVYLASYRDINLKMIIDLKINHKTAREKMCRRESL